MSGRPQDNGLQRVKTGVEEKEWLSSRDAKVRPTHAEMDKQRVDVGQEFVSSSGATLRFPGDPQAKPAETINCRCVTIPIIMYTFVFSM